jgi:4-amino-4-deoxy-L-arabinose transferase-like glycosyltransferase
LWWKDRRKIRERFELALPFASFIVLLIWWSFFREANDAVGLALLLPLVLAGASVLDRLSRSVASFMDWFSLLFFGLLVTAIWLYWTGALVGVPEGFARNMATQVPGFAFTFGWLPFSVAMALSLVWVCAVARAHRNSRRAVVNWAAGITVVWVLLNMFALSAMNHRQSYRSTAAMLRAQLPETRKCVAAINLGEPQQAMLDYYASLRFLPTTESGQTPCEWLLTQGAKETGPKADGVWRLTWEGARPGDNSERFRLYRRTGD